MPSTVYPELDKSIELFEIVNAVKLLKRNKAYGDDNLLNEYFIESIDILSPLLCTMFNNIIDSGYFPELWTNGVIIPLHKKGSTTDVNNYRGITLVSCLSKIFTTVLNKRIENICEQHNIISDAQFGFRKGRSTADAIFILMSLVQNFLSVNKRLYVFFVDMMKCFDSIYRKSLWIKLYKSGIQGKFPRIIRDMYSNVKSCVKHL